MRGFAEVIGAAMGSGGGTQGWFGDGSDGEVIITGDTPLPVAEDTGYIFKQYLALEVEVGATLRPAARCTGMVILVKGDLIINGVISMDKMAPRKNEVTENIIRTAGPSSKWLKLINTLVGGAGGRGGNHRNSSGGGSSGSGGGAGGNGFWCGGGYGGGGASYFWHDGDNSSKYYSGGASEPRPSTTLQWPFPAPVPTLGSGASGQYGAGGSCWDDSTQLLGGAAPGGSAGFKYYLNGTTTQARGTAGDAYGGGLLLLCAGGDIIINGNVTAKGGNGGAINTSYYAPGGGGGGGGIIAILRKKQTFALSGSLLVTGGLGTGSTSPSTIYRGVDGSLGTILTGVLDGEGNITID